MIARIFLGPALHWALIAILAGLTWLSGTERLHVTDFNLFVSVLIVLSILVIAIVIRSSPPGSRVTRDPIEDTEPD